MSQTVESKPHVFLDTSIQISRIIGSPKQWQLIESVLTKQVQAYTTNYVYMEYQRTLISDFAHVQRVLLEEQDWGEAVAKVAVGQRSFRPRALARVNRILGDTLSRSKLDIETGMLLLTTYLDYRLQDLFWHQVTSLPDLICCDLVEEGVTPLSDDSYLVADSCRKENATCSLPRFLANQSDRVRTLLNYLKAHPKTIKDQPRVERILSNVLSDPSIALGQSTCWPFGDIIILLQVPDGYTLWTLDGDFEPLAQSLGIPLYAPSKENVHK